MAVSTPYDNFVTGGDYYTTGAAGAVNAALPETNNFFSKLLGNLGDVNLGGLLGTITAGAGYNQMLGDLKSFGQQAQTGAETIGQQAAEATRFVPFTVTSGTGANIGTTPEGGTMLSLSPAERALQQQGLTGAGQFFGSAMGAEDPRIAAQQQALGTMFLQQAGQQPVPTALPQLTNLAYQQGMGRISAAQQPSDVNALRTPFTSTAVSQLNALNQPSGQLGALGSQAYSLGNLGLRTAPTYGATATNVGLQLARQGAEGLGGQPSISPQLGMLSSTALGQGIQGLGTTPASAQDVAATGAGLTNLGSQLLGQQPSAAIGQFGQQALGMGAQGLQGLTAPSDIEALRGQYGGLAGQAAQGLLTDPAQREADIYNRIRAAQTPEEQRQRLALEERLAAQGRLGTSSAAYGGATPEQLALETAQAEARNRASLAAMEQARAEQAQQLQTAQTLGGMTGQFAGISSDLQNAAQSRASQLAQLGLSAEQIQSQLQSEGLGRGLQATQAGLGATELASNLQTQAQNRASQLAQLGLSAEQIQSQLESEGLGRGLQTLQAGLQAQEVGSALQTQAQNRATQLAQLGLSTEQIQSQLESEGLGRATQAAGLTSNLATAASGLESEALQRGLSLSGLGLQGTQAAQGLTTQQLNNLLALQQSNIGASQAQQALRSGNLALGQGLLTSAYAPQSALLDVLQQGLGTAGLADVARRQAAQTQAEAQMAGLDAALQTALARGNLTAEGMAALAAALGGTQQAATGGLFSGIDLGDVWSGITGLI